MNEVSENSAPPAAVLDAFGLARPRWQRITSGHINRTWLLTTDAGETLILQNVNKVFPPAVQHDIVAVTAHLQTHGVRTLELRPTITGAPFLELDGAVWRLSTFIEGTTFERVTQPHQAREAARVLGEFHAALRTFPGELSNARGNIHDLSAHVRRLDEALHNHAEHRHFREINRIAARIAEAAAEVRDHPPTGTSLVHGDPKISNVVFDGDEAICLIDLDTLNSMPIELELADALRSWCNTAAEDSPEARCSIEYFAAACEGYADIDNELATILPDTTAQIAVELAARFCADALNENYFGWDAQRFESASAHNQARCEAQLQLAADILAQRAELRRIALAAAR